MTTFRSIIILAIVMLAISAVNLKAQYIRLHKNEIIKKMQVEMEGFNLDNSSVNKTFNYLKYVDYLGQQTILYFLDENDICTAWKWICDYALFDEKIKQLDCKYKRSGEKTWEFAHENNVFVIELEEKDWFFSIITRPKK